jgi:tRNA pseudouridine38-40 synthase
MRTFKLTLAYDGTNYCGWQSQPDQATVQGVLETAIEQVTGESLRTLASGRTDAGVHAIGQVASFSSSTQLSAEVLCRAINANLPHDVTIFTVEEVPSDFRVIRDVVRKRYQYVIQDGPLALPFQRSYAWHCPRPLAVEAMQQAARSLVGTHDFSSFQTSGSERETTTRTVTTLDVERRDPLFSLSLPLPFAHIVITIEADGFLYNMVRNIVGTLVEVGRGAESIEWVAEVLARHDRRAAGPTAPAHGLYLAQVWYDK